MNPGGLPKTLPPPWEWGRFEWELRNSLDTNNLPLGLLWPTLHLWDGMGAEIAFGTRQKVNLVTYYNLQIQSRSRPTPAIPCHSECDGDSDHGFSES